MTLSRAKAIAALLALACCASRDPQPDEHRAANRIFWHGHPRLPHALDALDVIHAQADAVCPGLPWCAEVHWQSDPFRCSVGGELVGGCQPYPPLCGVEVAWRPVLTDTALTDELGHYVWEFCFNRTGERALPDGGRAYDADFAAWIKATNQAIRACYP